MTVKFNGEQGVLQGRPAPPLSPQGLLGVRQPLPVLGRGEAPSLALAGPLLGL